MSQAGQQAAGAAVGAAVGAVAGGPPGAIAGASLGASAVGAGQSFFAGEDQNTIDQAALKLNVEQARLSASEKSAVLARNFRKSLASQVAIASMRGGAGSLAAQFGAESYQNFLQDQKSIDVGLNVSETQAKIADANARAIRNTSEIKTGTTFGSSALNAVNVSGLLKGRTK